MTRTPHAPHESNAEEMPVVLDAGADADRAVRGDEGFSLIEVIVSLSLLAIISTAGLYFFVSGTRTVTHQQRTHGAVTLANDAMETAFSYVAESATPGTSSLVRGRTQADVTAAWAAAASATGVSSTFPAWDTTTSPAPAAGVTDDLIPLTRTLTESRTQFTVTTLLGTCYRPTSSASGVCTKTGGDAAGTPLGGYARLMRSIVVVTWPDTNKTCGAAGCRYEIASLIDPSSDVEWNNTTRLLAMDDSAAVDATVTTPIVIDVLDNDTLMQISANPVTLVSSPVKAGTSTPMGTASVQASTGKVLYQPTLTSSGEVTFTYRVTVGARSAQAVVHVYVTPKAQDLAASTPVGTAVDIPISTVLGSAPTSLTIVQAPSTGTASVSGTNIRYNPAVAGTYTLKYAYTDSEGMTSLPGTVTVTVTTYAPPNGIDHTVDQLSAVSPAPTTLDMRAVSGNPTGYKTRVDTLPAPGTGTLKIGSANAAVGSVTTNALGYLAPARWAGTATFTYSMLTPDESQTSGAGTVLLRVTPVAVADSPSTAVAERSNVTIDVRGNDVTTSGVRVVTVGTPSCGAFAANQGTGPANGLVYWTAPNNTSNRVITCTFDYRLDTTDAPNPVLSSGVVRVTIRVNP